MALRQKQKPGNRTQQKTSVTDDLLDVLNPNAMLNNAQRVLSSAVNVLEEEIAAGILAAKRIEKKVIDVEDVRNNPENLVNRIRKDTHEVVDIFLDAIIALSSQLRIFSDNIEKQNGRMKPAADAKKQNNQVAILQTESPLKPGQSATLLMNVSNDDETGPVKVHLVKTDLKGPSSEKIIARNIKIQPASIVLAPGENKEVSVLIKIPSACKRGHYTALFTDISNPLLKALVNIEVE